MDKNDLNIRINTLNLNLVYFFSNTPLCVD